MKLLNLFFIIFLSTLSGYSQATADIYDVARKGTVDEMKLLFSENPSAINILNTEGFSPLVLATYRQNNKVAQFLIKNGANVNEKSTMGSPLMAAIVKGNNEIAQLLLQKKADVNSTDSNAKTALIYAVQFGNTEIISVLLKNGANKKHKDNQGKTAFEYAVFSGNEKIINQLK